MKMGQGRCFLRRVRPRPLPGPPKRDRTRETEVQRVLLLGPSLHPLHITLSWTTSNVSLPTANLLPRDAYESLKDKWDELKEVGVSNMKFGNQGPPEETEDRFSMPLIITIVCMASFLLLVAALYGCCHQRLSQRKDQVRTSRPSPGKPLCAR